MRQWLLNWTPKIVRLVSPLIYLCLMQPVSAGPVASWEGRSDRGPSSRPQEVELIDSATAAWLNLLHNEKHFGSPGYIYSWPDSGYPSDETLRLPFETGQPAQLEVIPSARSRSFGGDLLLPRKTPVKTD